MNYTANQLNEILQGELFGDGEVLINSVASIEKAKSGAISFLSNPKYEKFAATCEASVLICSKDFKEKINDGLTIIRVEDPRTSLGKLLKVIEQMQKVTRRGISEQASIAEGAKVATDVFIGAFTIIGEGVQIDENVEIGEQVFVGRNVSIGKGSIIYPGVKIYYDSKIGENCIIHSGTIIGSDGFGFTPTEKGMYEKFPQLGNVILENNVELGANCTIDRASIGSTIIGAGAKLDNLIHIAHGVEIGANTVIAAQTGISGSTTIGQNCMIGGQVGFVGHINIADGSKINAQSGVAKSINNPGQAWSGSPARGFKDHYKSLAHLNGLEKIKDDIESLKKLIKD